MSNSKERIMEAKALEKYIRISPRKLRLVADLVKGKSCHEALTLLKFTPRAGSPILEEAISSAVANAINIAGSTKLSVDNLIIKELRVDAAPTMKRYRPRARGRADLRRKRMSHILVRIGTEE
ncbi:MAG: 50S ribosomal protein L22 [Candidatus Edwardsbacteria bacterium]